MEDCMSKTVIIFALNVTVLWKTLALDWPTRMTGQDLPCQVGWLRKIS